MKATGQAGATAARDRRIARWLFLLLLAGVALRLAWALNKLHQGLDMSVAGEAFDVARHIAGGQGWAGAYGDDLPTAHLLPIAPLIAGGVYALFGVATPTSELTLWAYATVLSIGRIVLLDRCFARLGTGPWARLAAVAVLCLANPYLSHEAITFRTWDGGLAACLEAGFLLLLLRLVGEPSGIARRGWFGVVTLAALLFFINPMPGLAAFACLAVALWPRRRALPVIRLGVTAVGVLALLIGPWALRNERVLGSPVLLRSNAGLELALGMDPGAVDAADRQARFGERSTQLHPRASAHNRARVAAAGGEVAYHARLQRETLAWMRQHPADAARLMTRHLSIALFPPPWALDAGGGTLRALAKSVVACGISVLGLAGLALALVRRRRWWLHPALLVVIPALLMMPFYPYHRYLFLLFAPLVFAGADFVEQLWRAIRRPLPRPVPDR